MNPKLKQKLSLAFNKDPEILVGRDELETTLGSDAKYLSEQLGITKNDLIRLERLGFAIKARYSTENKRKRKFKEYDSSGKVTKETFVTGPHRIRWIIFKEALDV